MIQRYVISFLLILIFVYSANAKIKPQGQIELPSTNELDITPDDGILVSSNKPPTGGATITFTNWWTRSDLSSINPVTYTPRGNASGVIVHPTNGKAYVMDSVLRTMFVLNLTTQVVISKIEFTKMGSTSFISLSPDGTKIFASVSGKPAGGHFVNVADESIIASIATPTDVQRVVWSLDGNKIYATTSRGGVVYVINANTYELEGRILTGGSPSAIAITPDGKRLVVPLRLTDKIAFVDIESGRITWINTPSGGRPNGIDISPDGKFAIVSLILDHSIIVVDLDEEEIQPGKIEVNKYPRNIAIDNAGSCAYIAGDDPGIFILKISPPASDKSEKYASSCDQYF